METQHGSFPCQVFPKFMGKSGLVYFSTFRNLTPQSPVLSNLIQREIFVHGGRIAVLTFQLGPHLVCRLFDVSREVLQLLFSLWGKGKERSEIPGGAPGPGSPCSSTHSHQGWGRREWRCAVSSLAPHLQTVSRCSLGSLPPGAGNQ